MGNYVKVENFACDNENQNGQYKSRRRNHGISDVVKLSVSSLLGYVRNGSEIIQGRDEPLF
jgi:hypothetical protein